MVEMVRVLQEEAAVSLQEKLKKTSLTVSSLEVALDIKAAETREIEAKNAGDSWALDCFMTRLKGVIENKNREIAVLSKQLKTARDQVSALKSSVTNLTNEKVRDLNSWSLLTFHFLSSGNCRKSITSEGGTG